MKKRNIKPSSTPSKRCRRRRRRRALVSELARAYNNRAQVGDRVQFERAVDLLKSVEEHFQDEHNWNYRIAYAYYYLDEEGPALRHFEKALEARPGDAGYPES